MSSTPLLWSKKDGKVRPPLRRPKNVHVSNNNSQLATQTESQKLNKSGIPSINEHSQQSGNLDFETILKKSSLNANAEEWYPKNYVGPRNPVFKSNIQDRLKPFEVKSTSSGKNVSHEQMNSEYSSDLYRIQQIINTLTKDPGQFHNLLELFLESLEPYVQNVTALSTVAKIIVEQALNNPNFRYTAARLCSFVEHNSPSFRAELHLICKKQIEKNCDAKNVLPLIAELYTQLPHINVFGTLLITIFKKILELGGNDNIKCICQSLKLTGYSLEQSNKVDLDQIFNELGFVKGGVNGTAGFLLESIFQLRASNWGHSSEESDSEQDVAAAAFDGLQGEIVYEVEGQTLTAEEHEFITSHMNLNYEFDGEDFYSDEIYDPEPEMDEEIQEAFKEFLKIQSKH